jgi:hypothetical protein
MINTRSSFMKETRFFAIKRTSMRYFLSLLRNKRYSIQVWYFETLEIDAKLMLIAIFSLS